MNAEYEQGLPESLAGFQDEAIFTVRLREERLGTAHCTWTPDGRVEAHRTLVIAGQTVETTLVVAPDEAGVWREIVVVAPEGERRSTRDGLEVTRTAEVGGRSQVTRYHTPRGAVLFDDAAPSLASHALRLYDRALGGVQTVPLLVGGRAPVTAEIEALEEVERVVHGRAAALTRFRLAVPGSEMTVWTDEDGRTLLFAVPAQSIRFVREGWEALDGESGGDAEDPLLSAPVFDVAVERGVQVPMRDGVSLATDLYRPVGVERAPVILARTPYSRGPLELMARFYARRGYVFAAQDCRGCFDSPGDWEPFVHEGADGYDAIEWLAARPWADGKVGMIGPSYLGVAQWLAAAENPPHLVTIVPNVSPSDPFLGVPYEHGAFFLYGMLWWAEAVESHAGADVSGATLQRLGARRRADLLGALPVVDLDESVLGKRNPYWRAWIEHPTADAFWERASFLDRLQAVHLPVFQQSGWYDGNGLGTKHNYLRMRGLGRVHQKLILGPWGHTDVATRMFGERDFGERAIVDLRREYLRWFDRWLKGVPNGIDREPLVSLFVMGPDDWVHGDSYPLEGTEHRRLHLASGGHANTSGGDGTLSFEPPAAASPPDRFVYDPGDPTPSTWVLEQPEEEPGEVKTADELRRAGREHVQRILEERQDILVYETEPLPEPLTVAGPVSAELYASTSARDTDWFLTLSAVDAEGTVTRLVRGALRARYRDSFAEPELLEPGRVYRFTLDCWHTAVRVPAGSRLRLEVASAWFPFFSRNLGTGGHNETETEFVVARQTVFHDAERPSHLLLPVIEPGFAEGP